MQSSPDQPVDLLPASRFAAADKQECFELTVSGRKPHKD